MSREQVRSLVAGQEMAIASRMTRRRPTTAQMPPRKRCRKSRGFFATILLPLRQRHHLDRGAVGGEGDLAALEAQGVAAEDLEAPAVQDREVGAVAGVVCFFATQLLKRTLQIDDSLDVSPVHGVGGVVGTILTGVFVEASLGGVGFAEGMTMGKQLGVQLLGVGVTVLWCGVLTLVILKVLDAVLGLRVGEEQETEGLDLAQHGERGYSE